MDILKQVFVHFIQNTEVSIHCPAAIKHDCRRESAGKLVSADTFYGGRAMKANLRILYKMRKNLFENIDQPTLKTDLSGLKKADHRIIRFYLQKRFMVAGQ